jgi:N-acetylneuraminic acid mutarotase
LNASAARRLTTFRNRLSISASTLLLLGACGGGGSSTPAEHSLHAAITGLTSSGLVLTVNGAAITVAADTASLELSASIRAGGTYQVLVKVQPSGEICAISNGTGTMGSTDVSDLTVACEPSTYTVGGTIAGLSAAGLVLANGPDALAVTAGATVFTMGKAVPSGSAYDIIVQTQPTGLECGIRNGSGTVATSPVTSIAVSCSPPREWIWESGSSAGSAPGVYGTQGAAAIGNIPGARQLAASWTSPVGTMWLFGGRSPDFGADFNDLWSYDPNTGQWTWMNGSSSTNQQGVYGTRGVPASADMPGARDSAISWTDSAGNLWLFGGGWYNATTDQTSYFSDLWKYEPASGLWTWVSGPDTADTSGDYGVQGVTSPGGLPGAREGALSWVDSDGTLWLFGGYGYDGSGRLGYLDDLWRYDAVTNEWTWVSGSSNANAKGEYGSRGIPSASGSPGGREYAIAWRDATQRLWLFGGYGYDSAATLGDLSDLWRFDPASGQWAWVGGSSTADSQAVYGTRGVAAILNVPGARQGAIAWADGAGTFWLFGGAGFDGVAGEAGWLNDLWKYDVAAGRWTWVSGSSVVDERGTYGTQGSYSVGDVPGGRLRPTAWIDSNGTLWLFGGMGCAAGSGSCSATDYLNDLWSY